MATIYDVAKHAGTSISTVSHYLNKTKYVGPEKSLRIKEAIDTLSYVPNRAAKALKTSHSNEIHVVLPNLVDPLYAHTYSGISSVILNSNYTTILHLTNDVVATELIILEKIKKNNPAGILICSCQFNDLSLLNSIKKIFPTFFLYRNPFEEEDKHVTFNNEQTLFRLTKQLIHQGHSSIGLVTGYDHFSWDYECINGYTKAFSRMGKIIDDKLLLQLPQQKEAAFKYLSQKYTDRELPSCMIATTTTFTTAIKDIYAIRQKEDYLLITLGYESWHNKDLSFTQIQTMRESEKLGADTAHSLILNIERPSEFEGKSTLYKDHFDPTILKAITPRYKAPQTYEGSTLNLLLLDDDTSLSAIKALVPHFEHLYGTSIHIDTCEYNKLYNKITNEQDSLDYDLISADTPWLSEFVKHGLITQPSVFVDQNISDDTPAYLGRYQSNLFGLPYIIGLQLLFYRTDLFKDQNNRESFYAKYNRDLCPPSDWHHYNQIAEFFTRKYNKESPTSYGTCLANYYQGSILGEVLPRIWGYDGQILDEDLFPSLCTASTKKGFENYFQATKFGTPQAHYAQDVARDFCQGDIAMITSYVSYAPLLYDRLKSPIHGHVGFAPMPSDSSMVSGWSLCLQKSSKKKALANAFFEWFMSPDIAYRYALLTGNPTKRDLYFNRNLGKLYPWLPLSLDIFDKGHTRRLFPDTISTSIDNEAFEGLISHVIEKRVSSKGSLHSLLKQADRDLESLINHQ